MRKNLFRLSMVASLLCGFFLGFTVKAQGMIAARQQEQQVKHHVGWVGTWAEEPETMPFSTIRPSSPFHRVASSRPTRLLPTYGGKPNHHSGRWAKNQSPHLLKCFKLFSNIGHHRLRMFAVSPRRYYVIALRRLLC